MKKILLLGPRSKKYVTGVSLAFDLLIRGLEDKKIEFRAIDILGGGNTKKSGAFSLHRAWVVLKAIAQTWIKLPYCSEFYAIMSTSRLGFFRDFFTTPVAKFFGKKTILHLHGGGFEQFYLGSTSWLKFLIRHNLKQADKIIVLGGLLKKQFYCAGEFVKEKLVVVPNGLTQGVCEPSANTKSLHSSDKVELIYLSSLMKTKGYLDVINSIELLNQQSTKKYHLNLCGAFVNAITEGELELSNEEELRAFIREKNLTESITYHGQVVGIEKELLLKKSHIFLLPSYYPWEGQPLSIIEAMAYNTPIISCFHKGIPEMLEDGGNGYFVSSKSPSDIADKVEKICKNPEHYARMSKYSRKKYEVNFNREVHLNRLISEIISD